MGPVIKALGAGIGLAREAYSSRKSPSPSLGSRDTPAPVTQASSSTLVPPEYHENEEDDFSDSEDEKLQEDEAIWELDEAQPPAYSRQPPVQDGVDELVQNFCIQHPLSPGARPLGRLRDPVILPQRRPENRSRGFVRAYAPCLNDCGIDQQTFMDFLDSFDKSIEVYIHMNFCFFLDMLTYYQGFSISQGCKCGLWHCRGGPKLDSYDSLNDRSASSQNWPRSRRTPEVSIQVRKRVS